MKCQVLIPLKNPSGFLRSRLGCWRGQAMEAKVRTTQQLPLHLFAGLEVQRGRQGDGDVDEEARGLTFGADRLNAQQVLRGGRA